MGTVGCGEGAVGVGCSLVDLAPEAIDGGDDYEENNDVDCAVVLVLTPLTRLCHTASL